MKRFVDGVEVELGDDPSVSVSTVGDRLMVRGPSGAHSAVAVRFGDAVLVSYKGRQFRVERSRPRTRSGQAVGSGEIYAPMPGLVVDVLVSKGQSVSDGQKLVVLEAMKTQQAFVAPFEGTVEKLLASKGEQVQENQLLLVVVPVEVLKI